MLPAVPVAVVALVITGADGLIVNSRVALPVPPAFVALIVTEYEPAAVGVPLIWPVPVFTESVEGRPVAL